MFWTDSEDSNQWRYKRRHTILGKWHQIKKRNVARTFVYV